LHENHEEEAVLVLNARLVRLQLKVGEAQKKANELMIVSRKKN
jgi:hypothetical protein